MKNVLFISDSFLKGGLESRIISQINQLKKHKVNAFLACEQFDKSNLPYFKEILHIKNLQSYNNPNPPIREVIKTRNSLVNFCKKNKIDFIDCHPFCCVLPAVLCAHQTNIPISFTLHGIASGDFINYDYPETQIIFYLTMKYGIDQFFAVAEYLKNQYSFLSPDILIARNGTTFNKTEIKPLAPHKTTGRFAIASRLDDPKTQIILDFLPLIHNFKTINVIDIYGDGTAKEKLESFIQKHNYTKVSLKGWSNNLIHDLLHNDYDAVFGMGRVVLDVITSNIPVGILGYRGFAGFVTPDNLVEFAKTNLTSWKSIDTSTIEKSIKNVQKDPKKYILNRNDLLLFDDSSNWNQYLHAINLLVHNNNTVIHHLNLLLNKYFKLTTQSNIFELIQELNPYLIDNNDAYYRTLYTSIIRTNNFHLQISNYNKTIEEKEKIISQIKKETENTISQKDQIINSLEKNLSSITDSNFWKYTKPIRSTLNTIHHKQRKITTNKTNSS